MQGKHGGGLMIAGVIVMLVGLVTGVLQTWRIPGHWTPFLIGAALLVAGALWRGGLT